MLRGVRSMPDIYPLPSSKCQHSFADSLHAAHVITVLTSVDSFFTYTTVFRNIYPASAKLLSLRSRHPRTSNTAFTTPFSVSVSFLGRVPAFTCDLFHLYPRRLSRSTHSSLQVSVIFSRRPPARPSVPLSQVGSMGCVALPAFFRFGRSPGYA